MAAAHRAAVAEEVAGLGQLEAGQRRELDPAVAGVGSQRKREGQCGIAAHLCRADVEGQRPVSGGRADRDAVPAPGCERKPAGELLFLVARHTNPAARETQSGGFEGETAAVLGEGDGVAAREAEGKHVGHGGDLSVWLAEPYRVNGTV